MYLIQLFLSIQLCSKHNSDNNNTIIIELNRTKTKLYPHVFHSNLRTLAADLRCECL